MKNLAQFKARVVDTLKNGGTFSFTRSNCTQYEHIHPFFALYPGGCKRTLESFVAQKFGRVQSNAFTRLLPDGRESWQEWGKAGDWTFADENTAQWSESYKSVDHSHTVTLTYKFD